MKKLVLFAIVLMIPVAVFGQSAKTAVQTSGGIQATALVGVPCDSGLWDTFAEATIHMSNQKDLILGASLETTLFTRTLVKSKGGTSDTSVATAGLNVRVLVDDAIEADPGIVTFDRRQQSLMAKFNGICTDLNGDGIVNYGECETPEELELALDTTAAHHFNFLLADVGVGDHNVKMQGCVELSGSAQTGSWDADATARVGSLTVEEVRLVNGSDIGM